MAPTKYKEFSQNARIFGDHLRDFLKLLSSLFHYPPSLPVSPKRTHINPAPAGEGTRPSPLTSSHAVPFSSSTPQFKRPPELFLDHRLRISLNQPAPITLRPQPQGSPLFIYPQSS